MIKRYIKLLIGLVAVALIAIGTYVGVVISKNNSVKKAYENEQKKIIFSFDPLDITDMQVHNSSGDYSFRLTKDAGWIITEGDQFQIGADKFVQIAQTMCSLTATKILSETLPDNLDEYGLEDPMKVGFTLKDGTVCTADLGSQVPGDTAYYLKAEGNDTIYIVSEEDAENLNAELSELKDRFLFDTSGTGDINYLKYIDHGTIVYDIHKTDDKWTMVAPFKKGVVNGAGVTSIASLLIRAEAVTFIDEELTDPSKFGFDSPKYQIEVKTDEKEAKVIFGNYYDENQQYIYAYNKAIDQIYIFETASLGFIDSKIEDILVTRLHDEFFGNIKKFEMSVLGTDIDIDYQYNVAGETTPFYAINGKKVDREDEKTLETFNNLINSVTGLSFDYVCEDVLYSDFSAEPEVTITYKLKEGDDYVLELIPKSDDESLLYIVENGKYTDTVIRKTVIENGILLYYKEMQDIMK